MAKKRKKNKNIIYIVSIICSMVVSGFCLIDDIKDGISESNVSLRDDKTFNKILTDFEELEEEADDLKDEINLEDINIQEFASIGKVEGSSESKGTVVRVVDGDTYVLDINGIETKIRLIGVDTPESVAPADYSKENTQEGKDISDIVKDKIKEGSILTIEYDVSKTDKYGRTLAYLYFEDGVMVQEWLLNNGYAKAVSYQPNVKYSEHFADLSNIACENKTGLWNGFFE